MVIIPILQKKLRFTKGVRNTTWLEVMELRFTPVLSGCTVRSLSMLPGPSKVLKHANTMQSFTTILIITNGSPLDS
jgi:hypothetical protein